MCVCMQCNILGDVQVDGALIIMSIPMPCVHHPLAYMYAVFVLYRNGTSSREPTPARRASPRTSLPPPATPRQPWGSVTAGTTAGGTS
jgi:hypothetical protein